jgi:large subunit ribosomal protein L15
MPSSLKRNRKYRGSRTIGYGKIGQHRKAGQRGGKGNAGLHKYHWSWTINYDPDHFGKHGSRTAFMSPAPKTKILNIAEIENSLDKLFDNKIARKEGNKVMVNLIELGVTKVLGNGNISHPLTITAPSFSKTAIKKIQEAGGNVVIPGA